jgi:hypothetical protein
LHTTLFRNFFLRNRLYAIREGCLYEHLLILTDIAISTLVQA